MTFKMSKYSVMVDGEPFLKRFYFSLCDFLIKISLQNMLISATNKTQYYIFSYKLVSVSMSYFCIFDTIFKTFGKRFFN